MGVGCLADLYNYWFFFLLLHYSPSTVFSLRAWVRKCTGLGWWNRNEAYTPCLLFVTAVRRAPGGRGGSVVKACSWGQGDSAGGGLVGKAVRRPGRRDVCGYPGQTLHKASNTPPGSHVSSRHESTEVRTYPSSPQTSFSPLDPEREAHDCLP